MNWTWKALDWSLVVGAFLAALAIFFMPNWREGDEMKALEKAVNERKAARLAYEAREAAREQERQELGLVYYLPAAPRAAEPAPAPGREE